MDIHNKNILLVGAGKMGGALLAAWLRSGVVPQSVTVVETNVLQTEKLSPLGVKILPSLEALTVTHIPDCIVLAVKPQSMDAVLPALRKKFGEKGFYLSIAVGKTLGYFQKSLGNVPVVRAMPNTPALIRKGISGLCASENVTPEQKKLADALLGAAGEVVWLEDESLMDVVAAISGSGPAYVFLFLEALIAAGVKHGLPEVIAAKLALHTLRGSAKLAMKSDEPLINLRKNVTSPGGTTEAALKVLMKEDGLQTLMQDAAAAAIRRAKELA